MLFFPFSRAIRFDDHRLTIIKRRSSQVRHRGIYSQSMIIVNHHGCQGKLVVGIMWSRWARVTWSQIGSRFSGVGVSLAHLGSRVDHWSLCPSWAASRIMYNHVCGGLLLAFFRFVCVFYLFLFFALSCAFTDLFHMRHVCQFCLTLGHAGRLWMSAFECFLYLDTLPMWMLILVCIFLSTGNHSLRRVAWSCREGIIFHHLWSSHSLWGCQQHILGGHCNNDLGFVPQSTPLFVRIPFFGGKYSPRILSGFSFLGHEIYIFCGPGRWLVSMYSFTIVIIF